jgi:hypothetical protein
MLKASVLASERQSEANLRHSAGLRVRSYLGRLRRRIGRAPPSYRPLFPPTRPRVHTR